MAEREAEDQQNLREQHSRLVSRFKKYFCLVYNIPSRKRKSYYNIVCCLEYVKKLMLRLHTTLQNEDYDSLPRLPLEPDNMTKCLEKEDPQLALQNFSKKARFLTS